MSPTGPVHHDSAVSRLPMFRREASMPVIQRGGTVGSSIPQIRRREKIDLNRPRSRTAVSKTSAPSHPMPRGTKTAIVTPTTPKTVEERKVSERNNAARGTRSGVSGISDKVMIGDDVKITSSQKKGIVQFVGETRFAKGTWIGVVLEDATGKNDGSVGGVSYFASPALRGVFVREDKLEKVTDNNNTTNKTQQQKAINSNLTSPSSVTRRNDSAMSTDSGVCCVAETDGATDLLTLGDQVQITSTTGIRIGTLRFIGTTEFAKGTWCGVELNEASGKNDGAVAGTR